MTRVPKTMRKRFIALLSIPLLLASCGGLGNGVITSRGAPLVVAPALEVLALDFERTNFTNASRVSGRLAREQRELHLSTATSGRLRDEATGPIPTEVRVEITELVTNGNQVKMRGRLALRDLALGTIMAELPDFEASGPMPIAPAGAGPTGLIFRGVEEEIITWLSGLECDTGNRKCGKPAPKPIEIEEEIPLTEEGDIELAALVGPRPTGLRKINAGGIDPEQVIAAAAPVEPAASAQGETLIGRTVVALGLLERSGFWLQTPLVSTESTGFVVNPANNKRIAVTLIPKDGPTGGGSQMSLAAMTELGAQLTDLINVEVYR